MLFVNFDFQHVIDPILNGIRAASNPLYYQLYGRPQIDEISKRLLPSVCYAAEWLDGKDLLGIPILGPIDKIESRYILRMPKDEPPARIEDNTIILNFSSGSIINRTSTELITSTTIVQYSAVISSIPKEIRKRYADVVIEFILVHSRDDFAIKKFRESVAETHDDYYDNLQILLDYKMLPIMISLLQCGLTLEEQIRLSEHLVNLVMHKPGKPSEAHFTLGNTGNVLRHLFVYGKDSKNPERYPKRYKEMMARWARETEFFLILSKDSAKQRTAKIVSDFISKHKNWKAFPMEFETPDIGRDENGKISYSKGLVKTLNYFLVKNPKEISLKTDFYDPDLVLEISRYARNIKGNYGLPFGGRGVGTPKFKEYIKKLWRRIIPK